MSSFTADSAVLKVNNFVSQQNGGEAMRHNQHRRVAIAKPSQNLGLNHGINRRGCIVEQEHPRFASQGSRQGYPLTLTT